MERRSEDENTGVRTTRTAPIEFAESLLAEDRELLDRLARDPSTE